MAFNHKEQMAKRLREKNASNYDTLEIHGLLHGPEGVGRLKGRAVFVPKTVPGDVIKVDIVEKKKSFWRGEIINILEPSKDRREAPCHIFGRCGACQWLHIDYACQLREKEKAVTDAMTRIGKIEPQELLPTIASPEKYNYRRRAKVRCRMIAPGVMAVGFKARRSFRVISHDKCWIYNATILKAIQKVGKFLPRHFIGSNFLFYATCDDSEQKNVVSLQISVQKADSVDFFKIAFDKVAEHMPLRWEVFCEENRETTSSEILPEMKYSIPAVDGKERLIKVAPFSFFQSNVPANYKMVETVIKFAGLTGTETVADLYSGAGNFTVALAPKVKKIISVELDGPATAFAKINTEEFGDKVEIIESDVEPQIDQWIADEVKIDTIIIDPPREGCRDVVAKLSKLKAKKIVFCSCEPSTLARDVATLAEEGYKLKRLQVIDLFPQTYHVEAVAELILEEKTL
jgi:23S rRNA (uracil1939-C5)-methyltransferase